jgi:hypothetical protein
VTDRLLPHSTDAEEAVLGSILIDPEAIHRISPLLRPADFYHEHYGWVYQAMVDLSKDGVPPDYVAVSELLKRRNQLKQAGGHGRLTAFFEATPSSVHAEHYARIVADHARRRELIAAAGEIAALAYDTKNGDPLAFAAERIHMLQMQRPMAVVEGSTWADLDGEIGPIGWSWAGWLPNGFLTMIVAEQEAGKSILSLRIGGCFLRGDDWPDGTPFAGEVGSVVWVEAEASQAMNLERAKGWDLPIKNVLHPLDDPLEDVQLNNHRHRAAIAEFARRPDVQLVIVDSLSGGHTLRENSSSEMIPTVKSLAELARDTGKPVLLTHHARKRGILDIGEGMTLDRSRGSSGITQTARMVWGIDIPDPHTPDNRRLSVIKSNLAPKPNPLGFTVNGQGIVFGEAPEPPRQETQTDRAIELLQTTLDDGPVASTVLETEAKGAAISWSTMKRAKEQLGVVAKRDNDRWYWALPAKETA